MTDDTYDALDRATLATWRVGNLVVWTGAALLVAIIIHLVADELATRFHLPLGFGGLDVRPHQEFGGTWQFWAPLYGFRAGISIIIGLAIGTVLGLKAIRRPAALAALTATAYILITWLALETSVFYRARGDGTVVTGGSRHGFPATAIEWSYSVLGLIVLALAPLWARFVARRKVV